MRHRFLTALPTVAWCAFGAVACATFPPGGGDQPADLPTTPPVAGSAYEAAAAVKLPPAKGGELPGLHNVFQLSPRIISGSEPHGEEALAELARMGVKTVVSVDGQAPDHVAAGKHGLRYVHIPVQYKGLTEDEVKQIAKTFRELEGPFYVHCFHGKHRGPAAAAVGRIVLDGATRETAVAEMRQWCGTAPEYEGLYRSILRQPMPSAAETAAFEYDFPPQAKFAGFRQAMVQVSRAHDHVQDLLEAPRLVDPEHPDLDVVNEGRKLLQALEGTFEFDEVKGGAADMRDWMTASVDGSRSLLANLIRAKAGDAAARKQAEAEFKHVKDTCSKCHKAYRN
jgi:protein tyrosine phosphatase (PTP) superfamily phosphohydrolase (DUF442 family)